ncbi:aminotransferase class IV family protein [Ursidibacter arcticus]|uniref:aminotransferase class IV family protein n=1 Tax=Ursidibacter arcticus TaxID=1524965 RepID=UPI0012F76232|nr:aminotransferase class IV family protein [Ursidibacter arcticus]KAE9533401.1 branched-chain amino acid aminotransferase [Ursidibacter arcticus]
MCQYPLFETLAVINGEFHHLYYHQQRVNNAFLHYFQSECNLNLSNISVPNAFRQGFFRCRVDYNQHNYEINFYPYTPKKITQFKLVYTQNLDYQFKYSDRKRLDLLKNQQNSDEIIIINNGLVSDSTIGNLLFLKKNKWYSSHHYLLKGTQLSYLLDIGEVKLTKITADDLWAYEKIMMVNALNPFDLERAITINSSTILK